jgi:hypothetical protein
VQVRVGGASSNYQAVIFKSSCLRKRRYYSPLSLVEAMSEQEKDAVATDEGGNTVEPDISLESIH